MANVRALYRDTTNAMNRQMADADTAYLGGIDVGSAAALAIGATNANAVNISKVGVTTTIQGGLQVDGTTLLDGAATCAAGLAVNSAGSLDVDVASDFSGNVTVSGSATINQTSAGQVTFAGNVDATNGLDVTVAALSAAAGFNVTGGTVDVDVASDFSGNMNLSGTATFTIADAATFNGAVTLGNATSDDITVNGYTVGNIIPKTDSSNTLGNTGQRWLEVWCDDITVTNGITATECNRVENDYTAATGGITDRDVVYKNATNDEIGKAQANAVSTSKVVGIAMETISAASSGAVAQAGVVTSVGSGWTAGQVIYLSTSAAGGTQNTVPSGSGNIILPLGYAKNATDLTLQIQDPTLIA